jgi:hypothetical protein
MADEILMCLDKASTKTGNGKEAVSKEAQALLRQMLPKPTVDSSMSNPTKNNGIAKTPNPIGAGNLVESPETPSIEGDAIQIGQILKLIGLEESLRSLIGKDGDMATMIKYVKELLRTDKFSTARMAKLVKGALSKIGASSFILGALDTDLFENILKNSNYPIELIEELKKPDVKNRFLESLHKDLEGLTFEDYMKREGKTALDGIIIVGKSGAQIVDAVLVGAIGNMIEFFKGENPIDNMGKELDELFGIKSN